MFELARLGLGAVQREKVIEHPERQPVPADQFFCPLLTLRKKLYAPALRFDPAGLREILKDCLASFDGAVLYEVVPCQLSVLPKGPHDLEELIFLFYFRQHAERGMSGLTLAGIQFFVVWHHSSLLDYRLSIHN